MAVALSLSLAIVAAAITPLMAQSAFYSAGKQELSGRPGTLIRWQQLPDAPNGTLAYLILYRSTGLRGEPIAVSGFAVFPDSWPSGRLRPVVAWAHPTSGVVPKCAPSLALSRFRSIQGLSDMMKHGFAVVATDYPGLGTPGPHPYLVGPSEARAVLDSVRALQDVPNAHAGRDFAVWGHSQGGQGALYSGLLAYDYAPELKLVGIAAAAPATDLRTLFADDLNTPGGKNLTAMTLWAWSRVFAAPIYKVVTPQSVPTIDHLSEGCIESFVDVIERQFEEKPLQKSFLTIDDIGRVEPWKSLMTENTPGPLPRTIPVFLAQGTGDLTVRPAVTRNYMSELCNRGSAVRMLVLPGVGHAFIARDSAASAVRWMAERFAGHPAPNDCTGP